jgi:Domain of unknown function (DUF4272)
MLDAHDGPESNYKTNVRHPYEVAQRVLAILAVLDRTFSQDAAPTLEWVYSYGIDRYFSTAERDFYFARDVTEEERVNFSWLAESLAMMLWSLGYVDDLPPLDRRFNPTDIPYLYNITNSTAQFLGDACLRHPDALTIAEEQHCQAHWQAMHAETSTRAISCAIDPEIIYERRYAISWLVGWGESWENVPLDYSL